MQFHSSDSICFVCFSKWLCGLSPSTLPPAHSGESQSWTGSRWAGSPAAVTAPSPPQGMVQGPEPPSVSSLSHLCISRDCIPSKVTFLPELLLKFSLVLCPTYSYSYFSDLCVQPRGMLNEFKCSGTAVERHGRVTSDSFLLYFYVPLEGIEFPHLKCWTLERFVFHCNEYLVINTCY